MTLPENSVESSNLINRELSWLAFNGRVLQEAADVNVPLLERLKFLAIFSSNLDEFFRVRVASIRALLRLKDKHASKLDFNPARLLKEIQNVVVKQQRNFGDIFSHSILPALEDAGILLDLDGSFTEEQHEFAQEYFRTQVRDHLEPIVLHSAGELPFLKNKGLYLAAELWPQQVSSPVFIEEPFYGLLEIPSHLPRFVEIPSEDSVKHVVFLDDIIRNNLDSIFPDYEAGESYSVKVTRDAELYIDDEFTGNLVELIRKSLKKREKGIPTRFLYDMRMPYPMVTRMKELFDLRDEDLVVGGRYHNFSDFFGFPKFDREDLVYGDLMPAPHPALEGATSVLDYVAKNDTLIHFPYHSFDHILRFLDEAASDPDTEKIFATLYRTAPNSKVVDALVEAARQGKEVTAFVEVKARFDEAPNLESAHEMQEAGVNVLFSMPGIKVHSKLLLIKRRTHKKKYIAYLSTGNFNEKTARVYTDVGLFTGDETTTADVRSVFRYLEDQSKTPKFKKLLVAPFTMRKQFEGLIDNEIEAALKGKAAAITVKVNSLEDDDMIHRLYLAAQAGVTVNIICRGICCMKAGVRGLSDNIYAVSIVDKFLEHARAYIFENGGDKIVYLASADWMKRNLVRRVEVAFPIEDEHLKQEILDIVELQLNDDTKARILDAKLKNKRVPSKKEQPARAQLDTYKYYVDRVASLSASSETRT